MKRWGEDRYKELSQNNFDIVCTKIEFVIQGTTAVDNRNCAMFLRNGNTGTPIEVRQGCKSYYLTALKGNGPDSNGFQIIIDIEVASLNYKKYSAITWSKIEFYNIWKKNSVSRDMFCNGKCVNKIRHSE